MAGSSGGGSVARVSSIAGNATAPAVSAPRSHRATCTAQSLRRGSPYSRVPSSGSTIHTRSWRWRRGSSAPSSESSASSGRAEISSAAMKAWAVASPSSISNQLGAPVSTRWLRNSTSRCPVCVASRVASDASDSSRGRCCGTPRWYCRPPCQTPSPVVPTSTSAASRRLVGREEWFWYLAAAVSYITLSIWHKFLLNWFVGPLWLVAVVVIGPAVWDRLRRRGRRR